MQIIFKSTLDFRNVFYMFQKGMDNKVHQYSEILLYCYIDNFAKHWMMMIPNLIANLYTYVKVSSSVFQ